MKSPGYAVIDVETTHGDPRIGRVIDLAVLLHDGNAVVDGWSTLVDPGTDIPPFIQRLTGIDHRSLQGAPTFRKVARLLQGFTLARTVVAHNARFDMTALAQEFARVGLGFQRAAFCTEQLSRHLVPDLSHYNLGSMCRHFGIPFEAKHRAMSDARATAELFGRLMERCGPEHIPAHAWPHALKRSA